ncbi:hypothetical protein DL89DRAFT_303043 [Linderina pennispora]|uniref:Uncharacterized protein n=1 Tax=Linderina pennispora TaxID=61395 RepID=A0A1Y1W3U8_9FUNG|nr:uncharacterized protein DL89DRAFT_303043 [Linderina pennispora]ORX67946.1 hypothetical protein DL89DRAFT_303043 [Linderina pennispora]
MSHILTLDRLVLEIVYDNRDAFPDKLSFVEPFPAVTYMCVVSEVFPIPAYIVGLESRKLSNLVLEYPQTKHQNISARSYRYGDIMDAYVSCSTLMHITVWQLSPKDYQDRLFHQKHHTNMLVLPPSALSFAFCPNTYTPCYSLLNDILGYLPST